ncbi:MAG: DNA alkylation repair protein [Ignavibacteria bacterium]|nr:DNA alkylation repair protein [Ignavibacteria bacterium]
MEYSDKVKEIIGEFKGFRNERNIEGMKRYGINVDTAFGISAPVLTDISKRYRYNHTLALELWNTGYHDARLLASMIDNPKEVTKKQLKNWVKDFDSWDVCDCCCNRLFRKVSFIEEYIPIWCNDNHEFVKRAGFSMIAQLAVHKKSAPDSEFEKYFHLIIKGSADERNFVKKAVNWALRQIGKRNFRLNAEAINVSGKLIELNSKSARWIARDAIRELTNEKTISRLS